MISDARKEDGHLTRWLHLIQNITLSRGHSFDTCIFQEGLTQKKTIYTHTDKRMFMYHDITLELKQISITITNTVRR